MSRVSKHGSLVVLLKVLALNRVIGQDLTAASSLSVQLASSGRFLLVAFPAAVVCFIETAPVTSQSRKQPMDAHQGNCCTGGEFCCLFFFFKKLMIQRAVFGSRQGEVTGQSVSF
jgi:hypothetical protein